MLAAVMSFLAASAVTAVFLLVAVVVGMHQQLRCQKLNGRTPGPVSTNVRRLFGVFVREPTDAPTEKCDEDYVAGHPTVWSNKDSDCW